MTTDPRQRSTPSVASGGEASISVEFASSEVPSPKPADVLAALSNALSDLKRLGNSGIRFAELIAKCKKKKKKKNRDRPAGPYLFLDIEDGVYTIEGGMAVSRDPKTNGRFLGFDFHTTVDVNDEAVTNKWDASFYSDDHMSILGVDSETAVDLAQKRVEFKQVASVIQTGPFDLIPAAGVSASGRLISTEAGGAIQWNSESNRFELSGNVGGSLMHSEVRVQRGDSSVILSGDLATVGVQGGGLLNARPVGSESQGQIGGSIGVDFGLGGVGADVRIDPKDLDSLFPR